LKEKGNVPLILASMLQENLIPKDFSLLRNDPSFFNLVPQLMIKYNLLPNDAIILATCKIHSITKLASHDSDFIIPCKAEGIELLTED
jgi:predicted nucleic acid-binding protein